MPYSPIIAPDTQSLGNGICQAGQALADGYNEMKQNQLLASTATAKFEGALQSSPELLQVLTSEKAPANLASAYKKLQTGGQVGLKDAALLSTFADSFQLEKQKRQQQQLQAIQLEQAEQTKTAQDQANERAKALAQFASGNGVSMMAPQARASMKAALDNPVGQYIAQVYNFTGRAPSQEALTEFAKSVAMREGRGNPKAVSLKEIHSQDPKTGKPIIKTINELTGEQVDVGPAGENKYVLTPEEQIAVAGGTKAIQTKAESDNAFVNNVTTNSEVAQNTLPQINAIKKLYEKGVKTGFGQEFMTDAAAFLHAMGAPVDANKLGDQQYMKSLMSQQALSAAEQMRGQGSITEPERRLLAATAAQYSNTPEGNLQILKTIEAIKQRHIDMEFKRQELVDKGEKDPAEAIKRWSSRNTVQSYLDKSVQGDKAKESADEILKKYNVAH